MPLDPGLAPRAFVGRDLGTRPVHCGGNETFASEGVEHRARRALGRAPRPGRDLGLLRCRADLEKPGDRPGGRVQLVEVLALEIEQDSAVVEHRDHHVGAQLECLLLDLPRLHHLAEYNGAISSPLLPHLGPTPVDASEPGSSRIAQTNLQLYQQLRTAGWDDEALATVHDAYELVDELFVGQRRRSRKPFVAHLVGTASVVADVDGRRELVLAGLVHATYKHGEWGDRRRGVTDRKRRLLRAVVGADAEAIACAYASLVYTVDDLQRAAAAARRSSRMRDVVLLRIAGEVEEHSDLGVRLDSSPPAMRLPAAMEVMVRLAVELDAPALAARLAAVHEEETRIAVPASLVDGSSPTPLVPRSHRLRPWLRLRRIIATIPGARRCYRLLRDRPPEVE